MQFIGQDFAFHESTDGLVIERSQSIDTSYIDSLKAQRAESLNRREGEFMRVASVPVAIAEKWMREGYDIFNEPIKKTVAKLQLENLDDFITTNKQL